VWQFFNFTACDAHTYHYASNGCATEEEPLPPYIIPLCAVQKQGCVSNTQNPRHPYTQIIIVTGLWR